VRKGLIDTVLATDMSRHFVLVNKFTTVFGTDEDALSGEGVSEVGLCLCRKIPTPPHPGIMGWYQVWRGGGFEKGKTWKTKKSEVI
jgi:hypothetical protein